jgi:hypothetical protein
MNPPWEQCFPFHSATSSLILAKIVVRGSKKTVGIVPVKKTQKIIGQATMAVDGAPIA